MKVKATFKRNLLIGFGVSLLLLVVSSVASFFSIRNLLASAYWVDHTNTVILKLENTLSFMKDAETGQRGFLLTGDDRFLEPYKGAYDSVQATLNNLKELTQDNNEQQVAVEQLRLLVVRRQSLLRESIQVRKAGQIISFDTLQSGRIIMDDARRLVSTMEDREKRLLVIRTANLNRISGYTPLLIVIAALLALLITSVFYIRVKRDFDERSRLQEALEEKDREITRRIDIIRSIAEKISAGDYSIRVRDEEKDGLGSLSVSLNKMALSLETSFNELADKEWHQTGVAGLNDRMVGEKNVETLTGHIVEFLAEYTHSQVGALYLTGPDNRLYLSGSFALANTANRREIPIGQGMVGQCAISGKTLLLQDITPENITISYASGEIRPRNIVAVPIHYEGYVRGVIELASLTAYTPNDLAFLESVMHNIGLSINTSENRRRVQELLEETQAQSEELQVQHGELENINTELEAQAQKLQASEEELRVQQEELQQANQELEERSRLLEDRNQVIVERNLEIQKKAEELEISTKYKSEFLANMSHELRTPLNSILLLSRLMAENNEKNLSDDQIESAQVIQSSGKGLLNLIDEILDLSKIEAGKMDLEYAPVPVHEICNDMEALFGPIAREKNLALNVQVMSDAPALIETDKMRLEQILKNLLSNALKFTAKGAVTLQVTAVAQDPSIVRFAVRDTGIGIPVEKQQVIFEAFKQADGSTRRKYGGTGLGLSISRELAKLLGGEIRLESEPGHGSEFVVTIPLRPQENREQPVQEATQQQAEEVYHEAVRAKEKRDDYIATEIPQEIPDDRENLKAEDKIILIVEDDTKYAGILLDFTRKRGYKGVVAVRGDYGIEMAQRYRPAAILLDIVLPVQSGWQVMEALKSNPVTRPIPVHIISSLEAKKESLQKGAVDFINKPMALDKMPEIFQQLENALTKNPKKVLIVEENPKHAEALAYFLENFNVSTEITGNISSSVAALQKKDVNCVILDMGVPDQHAYETLETVKSNPGLENLPIIIFTGKNLSRAEENRIRQYADSIVIKTAHSYQRMLDEVALFLHLVEEKAGHNKPARKQQAPLKEVLQGKTVLIADDDVRNIFSLTKALEQHKMTIVSALDGKEAMQQLENNPKIDIVLMDMMMPEMDGYETIRTIRDIPKYRHLPILAVTAKTMLGDREKCIKAGASDYISKPVDIDQLVSLLRVWLYDNARG
ncbi:response regulator [Chitinophaga pinensis]|uniref:histidine kinase n=1 Tax=Chitinophaga pinensis (strain ATCC 43595 / DSM 2588 / LMG 13176 / NBRC 15968 / NCIMB 11800 / UQM 2034) TaxID=485918 RepID=A0A979G986_CHIPD|nr:response regulator [Chitinophaga pinensis]ACU62993.1 GAF sensor hybrid histidine kinase [Chitinophaga pinensis DSM 2588]